MGYLGSGDRHGDTIGLSMTGCRMKRVMSGEFGDAGKLAPENMIPKVNIT
jgi:hypothetical protein